MSRNIITPQIHAVLVDGLKPWPQHARKHSPDKLKSLIRSIQCTDLISPIIIDEADVVLSGHLRVEAFRKLGLSEIQAIRIQHLSHEQKAAFVIAANRFPERGEWDRNVLSTELEMLANFDVSVDLTTTGFEIGEIDVIIGSEPDTSGEPLVPEPESVAVSRPGDLWVLGEHRLLCGDCLQPETWRRLMQGDQARLCLTDPPYNVKIAGHVSSSGHREFAMASGEMKAAEFTEFLHTALSRTVDQSIDGAIHLIAMDHRHLRELYAACDPLYSDQLNLIVWAKTNAGMGSLYRSRHELFSLYKVGTAPHINNIRLGKHGRSRSNVWTYPGANTFRKGRMKDLEDHPTVKPLALVADAILDLSDPGEVVIDGFGGSGTLLLAAEHTRRRARVMEIDPLYVDVSIRRWEDFTGKEAILDGAGATFQSLLKQRALQQVSCEKEGGEHE